jgi:hypothetical protein
MWPHSEEKMFVRDLLLVILGGNLLRGLQRLLHFLGEFVDAHPTTLGNPATPATRSAIA